MESLLITFVIKWRKEERKKKFKRKNRKLETNEKK